MSNWPARTFKLLIGLLTLLAGSLSFSVAFGRDHLPPWAIPVLLAATFASWLAAAVVLIAQYRAEGGLNGRQRRRSPARALAAWLTTIVVASLVGALLGAAISALDDRDAVGSGAYAVKLSRAFRSLERARSDAYASLEAERRPAEQAKALLRLEMRFLAASASLPSSAAGEGQRRLAGVIASRLREIAKAYGALRRAIRDPDGDQAAVNAARRAIANATRRLRRAESRLLEQGYDLTESQRPTF